MTLFFTILILGLATVLLIAVYTLKSSQRSEIPLIEYVANRPLSTVGTSSHASLELSNAARNENLLLASLLEAEPPEALGIGSQCRKCLRTYESGTRFCYVDGEELGARVSTLSSFWVCTTCGHEGLERCSCEDGAILIKVDGVERRPLFPMARCTSCQSAGPIGSICEADKVERIPVFDVGFSSFPAKGFGPRRSVCLQCGSRFSPAANYCSYDGTRLNFLN